MATKFESNDDFSFDKELDLPEFQFGAHKEKSKRQVSLEMSKSALQGVKEGLTDEYFIRRTVRSALPSGYGTAIDIADEATSTLRSLYNDSTRELKPLLNDLKRVTKRIQEPLDKYLPRWVSRSLDKFTKINEEGTQGLDPEAQREATLMASLGEVFKYDVKSRATREQAEDARSRIREGIDQTRHKDSMGQLNQIRLSVAALAAYQNNVTANYQRKSLFCGICSRNRIG
jgi:hypothetical protein